MTYRERYRMLRDLNVGWRAAAYGALPIRWHAVVALAKGRSVMYRVDIEDGTVKVRRNGGVYAECNIKVSRVSRDERYMPYKSWAIYADQSSTDIELEDWSAEGPLQ